MKVLAMTVNEYKVVKSFGIPSEQQTYQLTNAQCTDFSYPIKYFKADQECSCGIGEMDWMEIISCFELN